MESKPHSQHMHKATKAIRFKKVRKKFVSF